MAAVETRGRSLNGQTSGFLSTLPESHRRSGSATPSFHSDRSAVTIVEKNSEFEDRKAKFKRRGTQLVTVKITSRWACLMGFLFGTHKTEDRTKATVKEPETEYDYGEAFDHNECAFVKTLSVLSCVQDEPIMKARSAFDTLCLQGNVVSLEFATKLGYTEAEFKMLKPRERHGGVSASGHVIHPKGAIYLSWYHSTSPQYSNMRFLVVENIHFDLVIGTDSIVRHNLISPPNLSLTVGVTVISQGDKNAERLQIEEMQCKGRFEDLKHKRKRLQKKNPEYRGLDAEVDELERLFKIAKLKNNEYLTDRRLKVDPRDKGMKEHLEEVQAEIKKLQGKGDKTKTEKAKVDSGRKPKPEKDKENVTPEKASDITFQLEEPNGKVRTPTGISLTDGSGQVRHRK